MQRDPALGHGSAERGWTWWLLLSLPAAALDIVSSLAGLFADGPYALETQNWRNQAMGQDIANLIAFPLMLLLAIGASRGRMRAALAWLGTLVYAVYAFVIYAFSVHFGELFLVYVAVLGLSLWALIGALANLDPRRVASAFPPGSTFGGVGVFLVVVGCAFALLWLSEILPALNADTLPEVITETGLPTNPVWILDLSVMLPTTILAGIALRGGRPWGRVLAPAVLSGLALIGIGIVALIIVTAVDGDTGQLGVGAAVTVLTVAEVALLLRVLRACRPDVFLKDALRKDQSPEDW